MASVKIASLLVRTLAKPISTQLKSQATQHPRFRELCINFAQFMHRTEVRLRTQLMGETAKNIRPLSEARAIENGAIAIAEGFLFSVAVAAIIGETYRSSRSQSKKRSELDDSIDALGTHVQELSMRVDSLAQKWEHDLQEERRRNEELSRILERVVEIGLRGGWAEFEHTPLSFPRIQLSPSSPGSPAPPSGSSPAHIKDTPASSSSPSSSSIQSS